MIREILIVDDIREIVKTWPIYEFDNKIFQENAGNYFFIDFDLCPNYNEITESLNAYNDCMEENQYDDEKCVGFLPNMDKYCPGCYKCVTKLPLEIAYFIMEACKFQRAFQALNIPVKPPEPEKGIVSYIPAKATLEIRKEGSVVGYETVDEPTVIPAKIGVIHVKEL